MTSAAVGGPVEHPGSLPPGTRVDRYEIGAVLSASDANIRYACSDGDDRWALLECFPAALVRRQDGDLVPHTANSATAFQTMLDEFLQDASNAASFRHSSIVSLHRTVRANGTVYAVMDYVEGETLASLLARDGPLSADRLESLANGLLTSLGALHGANLLHLGVEPGEIVVTGEDKPVVIASTLVRRSAGGSRAAFAEVRQQRRSTFVTSPYTAIELYATGGQIGPWTDLYGIAATLYHCVAGEAPMAALDRVLHDDLPALSAEAKYDKHHQGTLAAVDAALHVQPDARPRSVEGWRVAEQGAMAPVRPDQIGIRGGGSEVKGGGDKPRWAKAALGLLAVTIIISYVDTWLLRDRTDDPETRIVADASDGPAVAQDAPTTGTDPDVPERTAMLDVSTGEFVSTTDETGDVQPSSDLADLGVTPQDTIAHATEASEEGAESHEPAPTPAALVVETVPSGVEVWLAGERIGRTPLQIEGLAPGVRDISLRHAFYETINLPEQNFAAGQQLQIERRLARATGSLLVTTDPPGAWVAWRGEFVAESTPATLPGLPAGPIELIIGTSGYRSETVAAEVPRGKTGELEWSLKRAFGSLTLDLSPADATATVLGEDGGGYSAGMELPEGDHQVEVLHPDYAPRTTSVTVTGDTRVMIALERLRPCGLRVRGVPPAASYPFVRTFGGARNLGSASIYAVFTVQADGTVAEETIVIDAERSILEYPRNIDAFSEAVIDAVRRYQFDFEEGACTKRQRASLVIRFLASAERR